MITKYLKKTNIVYYFSLLTFILSMVDINAQSPQEVLLELRSGNERFISGKQSHPNLSSERLKSTAKDGQQPIATVLACSDSRSPVELIFDKGVGDIFVVRVAGNIAGTSELASLEYAAEHLKTPILLVLGHTSCGAVSAVASGKELHGHLPNIAAKIEPSVQKSLKIHDKTETEKIINTTIKENVFQSIADILLKSTIISKLSAAGTIEIHGAVYDLETGEIQWLGQHPDKEKLEKESSFEDHSAINTTFWTTPNLIFMMIFIFAVSLISAIIIFLYRRKK